MAVGAIISGVVSAIPALYKLFSGMSQKAEGKQGLANLQRPIYKTPETVDRSLSLSQMAYADPYMSGEVVMRNRADQNAANAYQAASETSNPFAALAAIQAQANAAQQNIGMASAQQQRQDMSAYQRMLLTKANYLDQEWQMNEFAPFAEKSQEYRDMIGAGNKNTYGGLTDISSAVSNIARLFTSNQGDDAITYDADAVKAASDNFYNQQNGLPATGGIMGGDASYQSYQESKYGKNQKKGLGTSYGSYDEGTYSDPYLENQSTFYKTGQYRR